MAHSFLMNGYFWRIRDVETGSPFLIDRTGEYRAATTDPRTRCIYLSKDLEGEFRETVLLHELSHCVMFSYGLVSQIHSLVPKRNWIEVEEWVCNFMADYGKKIFSIAHEALGEDAWMYIPYELERLVV